jgi:hypothetical protein
MIDARFSCLLIHNGVLRQGWTRNISGDGAVISLDRPLDGARELGIVLELPGGAIAARCEVLRLDAQECAVRFEGLLPRDKQRIEAHATEQEDG